ncbi:MAG: STAS domain-containing protein [Nitrospirae bacterium]|nr:STAS domain-containing protein [Nitrospirota bacterium]
MINFQIEDPGNVGVLTIEGDISIQNAEELKSNFICALHSVDKVFVNVEKVSDVDEYCLELFCSAHRTSVRLQKTFSFNSCISEPFRRVIADAGFKRHVGCLLDVYKTCLWADRRNNGCRGLS